jgi:hypothetical protein
MSSILIPFHQILMGSSSNPLNGVLGVLPSLSIGLIESIKFKGHLLTIRPTHVQIQFLFHQCNKF